MKLRKKRFATTALAFLLAITLLFSGTVAAMAEANDDTPNAEAIARAEMVTRFNSAVNRLKTDLPKFYFTSERGMLVPKKQDGLIGLIGEIIGGIGGIVGGMTGGSVKEIETILGYLLVAGAETTDYITVTKGEKNKDIIPVKGQDYVSALTPDDEFTYEYQQFSYGSFNLKITLPDIVNPTEDSALYRLFDVPSVEELFGMYDKVTPGFDWSKVQVKYTNISIECRVNQQEELYFYKTHYEASLAITNSANIDMSTIQFPDSMFVGETQINNLDWTPRVLGDGDGDGYVYASDARECLRISVGLAKVTEVDFPYYDVDKDGKITASDARLILRASTGLQTLG